MTPEKYRKILSIVKQLNKLAIRADELELTLPNGAEAGCMIAVIANDLKLEAARIQAGVQS